MATYKFTSTRTAQKDNGQIYSCFDRQKLYFHLMPSGKIHFQTYDLKGYIDPAVDTINIDGVAATGTALQKYTAIIALFPEANSGSGGSGSSVIVGAVTDIPFNNPKSYVSPYTVTGPIKFTINSTGAHPLNEAFIRITADGVNTPDFSDFKDSGNGTYDNTLGVVNQVWFVFDGVDYCITRTKPIAIAAPGGGGISWTDLTFATKTNLTNTAGVWTATTASGFYANTGLDAVALQASTNGAIRCKYHAGDGTSCLLGFNAQNENVAYNGGTSGYEYGLYIGAGGAVYPVENGVLGSQAYTASVGDYLQITRTGNTFKLQSSPDGTTWTDRYTFTATSVAKHYVNIDIYDDGGTHGKMYFPQQTGLS